MNIKRLQFVVGVGLLGLLLVGVETAWGFNNNGWETNNVYACQRKGDGGRLRVYTEAGAFVKDLAPAGSNWWSLTFAGKGSSDARLFVMKPDPYWDVGNPTDLIIAELDTGGNVITGQQTTVSTLLGLGPNNLGTDIEPKNIRYSPHGDSGAGSLFVGVNDNDDNDPIKIYEIDLDLTTILKTCTGPGLPLAGGGHVAIAVNWDSPVLYATSQNLGGTSHKGDVIAFDISGGSTSSYTTLINGSDFTNANWYEPEMIVYRGTNNPDNRPTIVITFRNPEDSIYCSPREHYLDAIDNTYPPGCTPGVDCTGNLTLRQTYTGDIDDERLFGGQLDQQAGVKDIWWGSVAGGLFALRLDDTEEFFSLGKHYDTASPGVTDPTVLPPTINEVTPDPKSIPVGTEYIEQLTLSEGDLPITWTKLQGPAAAKVDGTGKVYDWIPSQAEAGLHTFEIKAENDGGHDTESWQVEVLDPDLINNGFRKDYIYLCQRKPDGGRLEVRRESDGSHVVNLAPAGSNWWSLTFSGTGNNDARLFVMKPDPYWGAQNPHDLILAEMNSSGAVTKQTTMATLLGLGAGNLGSAIEPDNIRYNPIKNSLFVGVNDESNNDPIKVYEIDLGLSTVLNTYTGPGLPLAGGGSVCMAIDETDGTLYVTSENLNGSGAKGDVVAFDTSGGSTSSYTTLIDGDDFGTEYDDPEAVIYRGAGNPSEEPTILLTFDVQDTMEFYLNQKDANNNLVKRASRFAGETRLFNGQLDVVSGTAWIGSVDGAVFHLEADDDVLFFNVGKHYDVDSPPGVSICNEVVFADADEDGDVDQGDFAIFQVCYTGANGGVPFEPAYCKCFNRDGDNDVDNADFTAFQDCATGPNIPFDPNNPPGGCNP
ncbi:MAG: hypothetical protein ACYTF1_01970 [Planctomycetota bacterium]|jgi:hypothetical protein